MREDQMIQIADMIARVIENKDSEGVIQATRAEVEELTSQFPLYSDLLPQYGLA
jgi:glycine/serine hydroxymethyltransferase